MRHKGNAMTSTSRLGAEIKSERSTSDAVYETLKNAIIRKRLSPGERLVEAKIAKEMKVSITPLRHAFTRLAKEGLITVFPFKGTYVVQITQELVKEILVARMVIERKAADIAFEFIDDNDIGQLEDYINLCEQAYEASGDVFQVITNDVLFHQYIFEKCGNSVLCEMWNVIKSRIMLLQSYSKDSSFSYRRTRERHAPILDALRRRDRESFLKSIEDHLTLAYRKGEYQIHS